jgi:hypothetical protein
MRVKWETASAAKIHVKISIGVQKSLHAASSAWEPVRENTTHRNKATRTVSQTARGDLAAAGDRWLHAEKAWLGKLGGSDQESQANENESEK